ncbi:MAG: carbohydrate ABC transporter permease [Anaerolineaceae bacterium]|nr:carbohydrate ABC transporter permease [Anaerolineaceae bacterium]
MKVKTPHKQGLLQFISKLTSHLFLILASVAIGLPFFWMITTAFKSGTEVFRFPPVWIPKSLIWSNFAEAWKLAPFGRFYFNSILTSVIGVVFEVLIAVLSAYAFARIPFPKKYKDPLFMVVLAAMMIPSQLTLIPNYVTLSRLKWIDTYAGIIVPSLSSVFGTFLLRQSFLSMNDELFDAAKIDGAGHFTTMLRIALPLARPVLATLVLFVFIGKWNAYLWPLIVTNTEKMRTLPVGLAMVRSAEYNIGPEHLMAASLFVLLPILIVFVLAQKQLVEGISAGAIKG